MRHDVPVAGFQAAISDTLKAESGAVERRGLLGITNPEDNVIETVVFSKLWLDSFVCVACLLTVKGAAKYGQYHELRVYRTAGMGEAAPAAYRITNE